MNGYEGTWKILRFNWPWYAGAALVTAVAAWTLVTGVVAAPWTWLACTLVVFADLWLVLSLVVSHVIYDRSDVQRGQWLDSATTAARAVGIFHFGQDEASGHVARRMPTAVRLTFDLYEPRATGSPSLRRARASAKDQPGAIVASLARLPLADGSIDLGVLAFAAHEVRNEPARVALFRELRRVLAANGRLLVVEHLRDGWNLLAYGPGCLHFLSRPTWLRTFDAAGLHVAQESRLTPWVRRFEVVARQ